MVEMKTCNLQSEICNWAGGDFLTSRESDPRFPNPELISSSVIIKQRRLILRGIFRSVLRRCHGVHRGWGVDGLTLDLLHFCDGFGREPPAAGRDAGDFELGQIEVAS